MSRRRSSVLAAATLVGGTALAIAGAGASAPSQVTVTLTANGAVQAGRQIDVGFSATGPIAAVAVRPGDHVSTGQVLARLEDAGARAAVASAEAALAAARAKPAATDVESAQQALQDTRAGAKQDVAALKLALAQAKQARRTAVEHVAATKVRIAEEQATYNQRKPLVDAAAARVDTDKRELAAAKATKLAHDKDHADLQAQQTRVNNRLAVDQEALQAAEAAGDAAAVTAAKNRIAQDQAELADLHDRLSALAKTLLDDGDAIDRAQGRLADDEGTLNELESQLAADEAMLDSDRKALETEREALETRTAAIAAATVSLAGGRANAQQSVHAAENAVRSALAARAPGRADAAATARAAELGLEQAQQTLEQTVLRAPAAGTISVVNGSTGELVGGGTEPFATILAEGLEVEATFSEVDAAKLRPGQPVSVVVGALANEQLTGRVTAVAEAATVTEGGAPTYAATIALAAAPEGLKPGMTVEVEVRATVGIQ